MLHLNSGPLGSGIASGSGFARVLSAAARLWVEANRLFACSLRSGSSTERPLLKCRTKLLPHMHNIAVFFEGHLIH
jgi:hypothetical protein